MKRDLAMMQAEHERLDHELAQWKTDGLTWDELEELKEAFVLFDLDGGGSISADEFLDAMTGLGFTPDKHKLAFKMVNDLKAEGKEMDFTTFVNMMTAKIETQKDLDKVFHLFDYLNTGTINFEERKRIAKNIGDTATDEDLKEMIQRANTKNTSGNVTPEEFYAIMNYKTKMVPKPKREEKKN